MGVHAAPHSEFAFLACLERHFPHEHPSLLQGRGDDCAVVAWPAKACISADLFVEHVHFRRSYFSPEDIGHKALAVNLSDLAGMGASALGFCLCVQANPEDTPQPDFWDRLFSGMALLAARWNIPLVGGDLSRASCLGLSITVWGHSERPVHRGRCRRGDLLFTCAPSGLSGALPLGLARTGLLALEQYGPDAVRSWPCAVAAHLRPEPMLDAAPLLSAHPGVHSLMDLSDGLAADLPRLLGAEKAPHLGLQEIPGADLRISHEALHPELMDYCRTTGRDPLREAVLGGEDYCLVGACDQAAARDLGGRLPGFAIIGVISDTPGLSCNGEDMRTRIGSGFDHFRNQE